MTAAWALTDFWVPERRTRRDIDPTAWQWPDLLTWGRTRLFLLTVAAYVLASVPAHILIRESGLSSVFFIPAGLSVAFLLRLPSRHWWVVLAAIGVGETAMDVVAGYPPAQIAGFVTANMLEPLIGASIVRKWCGPVDLATLRHVAWFLLGAVVFATAIGAAVGSLPVAVMGDVEFTAMFSQWWLGDAVGVIIIGGLILALGSSPDRRSIWSWSGVLLLATSSVALAVVLRSDLPLTFLVLVGVILAGAAYGIRAVAITALALAMVIALEIGFGSGPLIIGIPDATALLIFKLRLGVFTLAGLVVAAEAFERSRAIEESAADRMRLEHALVESAFERRVALRLQRALLPRLPDVHPDLVVAARYEAGDDGLLIGGDWYDVFPLPKGRVGFTVGDVAGHGLDASTSMGTMRTAVRVLAMAAESPGDLLDRLDAFTGEAAGTAFATAVYAVIDPALGTLDYASAGHPPMLLVESNGATRWLNEGLSPPLYGGQTANRPDVSTHVPPGALVLVYSDGLIERRGESIDIGLGRLERAARKLSALSPQGICNSLFEEVAIVDELQDDVVILALRLTSDRSE